jgi:putative AlgH/UPF0301 family transcriptional regulator
MLLVTSRAQLLPKVSAPEHRLALQISRQKVLVVAGGPVGQELGGVHHSRRAQGTQWDPA